MCVFLLLCELVFKGKVFVLCEESVGFGFKVVYFFCFCGVEIVIFFLILMVLVLEGIKYGFVCCGDFWYILGLKD